MCFVWRHSDLDLHLSVKVDVCAKFEELPSKRSWDIGFTRMRQTEEGGENWTLRFRPCLFAGMEAYKTIVTDITTWLHVLWLSVKETSEQPNKDWTSWKCNKSEKPDNKLIKRVKSDPTQLFLCSETVSYSITPVYWFIYWVHYKEGNLWLKLFRNQSSKLFFCLNNEVVLHCMNQNRRRFKKKKDIDAD